jgi:hypothetical protein
VAQESRFQQGRDDPGAACVAIDPRNQVTAAGST